MTLVARLSKRGVSVTGVTKATLGLPEIANVWIRAGVNGLGESRIENIETMRRARVSTSMTLIRTPMLSQVNQVVANADISCNTEISVIEKLSTAARKAHCVHRIILMVELGDLREGIMPDLLAETVRQILNMPNIRFQDIGTNLACRSGVSPDERNMATLSLLADQIDTSFGAIVRTVSGGNSANLQWALSNASPRRINNLRLGEAMLLGREALNRQVIKGTHTDAITLIAEVIELKNKPSKPCGTIAQAAFGKVPPGNDQGDIVQAIFAIGRQDVDPEGLVAPPGLEILAASSDHLIVDASHYRKRLSVGSQISFQLNYSALLRSMTSPFIAKVIMNPQDSIELSREIFSP